MDLLAQLVEVVLHLDKHLGELAQQHGPLIYGILMVIIFCETGLVVTPFLPGDSLLFAAGALAAATGAMSPVLLFILLTAAAVLGDSCNYAIGHFVGPRVFREGEARWLNRKHLERTHRFFERYGAETIVIARFVPIVRTFAPFVAGIGAMSYPKFLAYNVGGGAAWVGVFVWAGYFFGNLPPIRDRFGLVVVVIILISLMPAAFEFWRARTGRDRQEAAPEQVG